MSARRQWPWLLLLGVMAFPWSSQPRCLCHPVKLQLKKAQPKKLSNIKKKKSPEKSFNCSHLCCKTSYQAAGPVESCLPQQSCIRRHLFLGLCKKKTKQTKKHLLGILLTFYSQQKLWARGKKKVSWLSLH